MTTQHFNHSTQPQLTFIKQANRALQLFFRWRKTPFYLRQLQVLFETQFFHITTTQAIYQLVDEGILSKIPYQTPSTHLEFIVPSKVAQNPQASKALHAHMKVKARLVDKYSLKEVTKDLGDHLESLVKQELRANGLKNIQHEANSYGGKTWNKTGHDLDFIADYPYGIAFGVEVKNELGHIDPKEFSIKLEMCQYLGLRPIFIVRYMPWSFTPSVTQQGGYMITLGNQIYPLGYRRFVQELKSKLSLPYVRTSEILMSIAPKLRQEWPLEVRTDLPEDVSLRLATWFHSIIPYQL